MYRRLIFYINLYFNNNRNIFIFLFDYFFQPKLKIVQNIVIDCIKGSIQHVHFQLLYETGEVLPAYKSLSNAAAQLGMKESETPQSSFPRRMLLILQFMWFWRRNHEERFGLWYKSGDC